MSEQTPSAIKPADDQNTAQAQTSQPPEQDDFEREFDRLAQPEQTAQAPSQQPGEQTAQPQTTTTTTTTTTGPGDDDDATDPDAQPQGSQPTAEQLWANLTPAQKEALSQLQHRATAAEELAKRHIGQVGGLQRKINEILKSQAAVNPAAAQPTAAQVTAAMADPEEWKKLEEDFPTIAQGFKKMLEVRETKLKQELQAMTQPLLVARQQDQQEREQRFIQEQVRILAEAHPDWGDIRESPEFHEWLAAQPPFVQSGIKSRNAADAVDILNRYKSASAGKAGADLEARRKQRVQQAAAVQGSSGRATQQGRPAPVPDDYEAAWGAYDRQSARR